MYGNYGRLQYMGKDGNAYFTMRISKSALPYESEYNTFVCTGHVPEYNQGYPLTLYGDWQVSEKGKWKFIVSKFEEDLKSGRVLVQFLMDNLDGVGEKTAEKLAALGDELWNIVETDNFAELSTKTKVKEDICKMVVALLQKKRNTL